MALITPEYIETLQTIAKRKTWDDKMKEKGKMVDDFAGGNVDDAFDGGYRAGETAMAREVLDTLGIAY